jgi:hypothetical protein
VYGKWDGDSVGNWPQGVSATGDPGAEGRMTDWATALPNSGLDSLPVVVVFTFIANYRGLTVYFCIVCSWLFFRV